MTSIDQRVVSMTFDNVAFERNLRQTITSLDNLTEALKFKGAQDGLKGISDSVSRFDLSKMAAGVENISNKFSLLGAIGFSVIQNLTNSVLNFAKTFAQEDILGPMITGGKTRAGNIEQAKFQFRGLGMDVDKVMADAKFSVLGTAYGLGDAAKAAAQFGASGIQAGKDMRTSLGAIAGVAAMTGSTFGEISYLFTSSAALNKITNMDLQQFATRGLNAAAAYAKQTGITEAKVHELATKGKLDYKSFAEAMNKAFGSHAKDANETYTGSLANMRAALSRVSASFFGPQMVQQRDLFNTLTPVIDKLNEALQPLVNTLLGIRQMVVSGLIKFIKSLDLSKFKIAMPDIQKGFLNAFDAFGRILETVKKAFRDVFPKSEVSKIVSFAKAFKNFTENLKMGGETANNVRGIFRGIFSVFSIGMEIVKGIYKLFKDLFSSFAESTGLVGFLANIGNSLFNLKKSLVDGKGIANFFVGLGKAIKDPITFLKELRDRISNFFGSKTSNNEMASSFNKVRDGASSVVKAAKSIEGVWDRVLDRWRGVIHVLDGIWDYIKNWFSSLGKKLAAAFKPGDFDQTVDVINVGLLGGIAYMLKKFVQQGGFDIISGGLFKKIGGMFDELTNALKTMQTKVKADALFKIASAVGILVAAIVVLSMIDSVALSKALAALSVSFGELIGAMTLIDKLNFKASALKLAGIAAGMTILASAAVVLSAAIKILSTMSWEELAKGLTGVGVGLGILVGATRLISTDASGLITAGLAMIAISTALIILSEAVKSFADLSWADLAKGLTGVAVGLGLLTLAMNHMPPSSILSGAGLIEIATGLSILAGAVKLFSLLGWAEMAKGMVGIGAGLVIVAGAMHLMPLTLPITAAGMVLLSVALVEMAGAVRIMGKAGVGTLAKGLGAFAILLGELVVAMNLMNTGVAGAAAMVVVAGALVIFTKVIKELGALDLGTIAKGLGAIALVIGGLGLAAAIMEPIIPALLGLGAALTLVGGGFALFGLGAAAIAKAFELMAKAGVAGAKAMVEAVKILVQALPTIMRGLADSIVNFAEDLLHSAPLLLRLFTAFLEQLLETVNKEAPKIGQSFSIIIIEALRVVRESFPDLVKTGFEMLKAFLYGVLANIYEITTTVAQIIVEFNQALTDNMPQIVQSAANLIVAFLTELANHAEEIALAGLNLLVQFLNGVSQGIGNIITAVGTIITTFITETGNQANRIVTAGVDMMISFIQGIGQNAVRLANAAGQAIVDFLNGLADAIERYTPQIQQAGIRVIVALINGMTFGLGSKLGEVISWFSGFGSKVLGWVGDLTRTLVGKGTDLVGGFLRAIVTKGLEITDYFGRFGSTIIGYIGDAGSWLLDAGWNIIQGLWNGISNGVGWLKDKIGGFISDVKDWFTSGFGIFSPSRVFRGYGVNIVQGFANGILSSTTIARDATDTLSNEINKGFAVNTDTIASTFAEIVRHLSDLDDFNPVITPVLDLTKVQSAASGINGYLKTAPITPEFSTGQANVIASSRAPGSTSTPIETGPTTLTFEQNIYAPTALSTNDIYRNTKSQIKLAKDELGIT